MREYLQFITDPKADELEESELPLHMVQYLKRKQITEFPKSINEERILRFDSNFECGNLDSVYI